VKICGKCGRVAPPDQFHAAKGGEHGVRSTCKACNVAAQVQRQKEARESLEDWFVRAGLWRQARSRGYSGHRFADFSPELVGLKREQIGLSRLAKLMKQAAINQGKETT
jgi:hypothetical protein